MLDITGVHIEKLPFTDLKLVYTLMSFEGEPFLQHFQDERKNDVLGYLVDYNEDRSRWLFSKVSSDELLDYLSKNISLKSFLSNLESDLKFFVEMANDDGKISSIRLIYDDIDERYLPKEQSFFPLDVPEIYSDRIKNYYIIKSFLENSVYIKAEPKESVINSGLVRALDGADLLYNISLSFDKKVEKEVKDKLMSVGISNVDRISVAQKEVGKLYTMNIAKVKVASFAVALCPNHIINIGEHFLDRDWMINVLKSFKNEVIEVGNKSSEEVDTIVKGFSSTKELRAIYEPIIKLYQNKNIVVSLTDNTFKSEKVLKPVSVTIASKLIVDEPKQLVAEVERLAKVKFNEKTHKPTLSGYTLFEQDIETSWETKRISDGEYIFTLSSPLISRYNILNGLHILENPLLDIYATGELKSEAIFDFNMQFESTFISLNTEKVLNSRELKRKQYLDIIIDRYEKK